MRPSGLGIFPQKCTEYENETTCDSQPDIERNGFVKIPPLMKFKAKGTVKAAKFGTVKVREPNTEHRSFVKIPPKMRIKLKSNKENDSETG